MDDVAAVADTWGEPSDSAWAAQVRHPRRSTDAVSKALGIRPSRAFVAGEARTTGAGAPLRDVQAVVLLTDLGKGTGRALESRLRAATRKLRKHAALLRSWRRSGGTLAYYVTIHGEAAMGCRSRRTSCRTSDSLGVELGIEACGPCWRPLFA